MRIGGTIRFDGGGLRGAERMEDGGVTLTFADQGSCEMHLEFSPENSKRLAAVAGLLVQAKNEIDFKEDEGDISAKDFTMLLSDQDVTFSVEDSDDDIRDEGLPTIHILPGSKPDLYSGIYLGLNVAQAEELERRLHLFVESIKDHAEACKPKRIGRPVAAKGAGARASA